MFNFFLIFILKNIFIVGLIFWFLNFVGSLFFDNKYYLDKVNIFECGFLTTNININININVYFLLLFFIIYDLEFLVIIPFNFNLFFINYIGLFLFFVFILLLIFTFLFDWYNNICNWNL